MHDLNQYTYDEIADRIRDLLDVNWFMIECPCDDFEVDFDRVTRKCPWNDYDVLEDELVRRGGEIVAYNRTNTRTDKEEEVHNA